MCGQSFLALTERPMGPASGRARLRKGNAPDYFWQNARILLDNTQWGYGTNGLQGIPLFAGEL
jgi:hypothetical protein